MTTSVENVVVLGASPDRERYSNKAMRMLAEYGHRVIPVSPVYTEIDGAPVLPDFTSISQPVDTLTLYLSPKRLLPLREAIVQLRPKRVIFNPGTETPELQDALDEAGIAWEESCTLVLLRSGQF